MFILVYSSISLFIICTILYVFFSSGKKGDRFNDILSCIFVVGVLSFLCFLFTSISWNRISSEYNAYSTSLSSYETVSIIPIAEDGDYLAVKNSLNETTFDIRVDIPREFVVFSINADDLKRSGSTTCAKIIRKETFYSISGKRIPILSKIFRKEEFYLEECVLPKTAKFLYKEKELE